MSILTLILMYAGWSSMFPFGKMALEYSPPLFLTASRMLLAGALLLGFFLIKSRSSFRLNVKQILLLSALALFSIYLTNALEFWSLQHMSAAKTCFIYSLSPFFSALFSYLHFKERMTPKKWLGMLIGFLGVIPVLSIQKGASELVSSFFYLSWPELAMIGASICTVYGWILLRIAVKNANISPFMANGMGMFIGGIFALVHSYLVESWAPIPVASHHLLPFSKAVFGMTFISNIICYNIYGLMLKRFTATFISFMGVLSPIFASISSWIFLKEPISLMILLSTAVVSLGLWMIYSSELSQGYIQKKQSPENPNQELA